MNTLPIRNMITLSLMAAITQIGFIPRSFADFDAHEWGTFTSLVGSNGITQNGMYHEDETLPGFVHPFGATQPAPPVANEPPANPPYDPPAQEPNPYPTGCHGCKSNFARSVYSANKITQKMETPVIYFYNYGDQPQRVNVDVKFPEGVITETFPAPVRTSPSVNDSNLVLRKGETQFVVDVQTTKEDKVPSVDANNIYAHARNVASNTVKVNDEVEKFIFYRGLGRFQPRLHISSVGRTLTLSGSESALPQEAFLVHVDQNGQGQLMELPIMSASKPVMISAATIAALEDHSRTHAGINAGDQAEKTLISGLLSSGLNFDEAKAMVDTWEHGYLKVPGLRLLYILPRSEVDEVLPLTMTPAPTGFVRSFVGRIEILLQADEQKILSDILAQGYSFKPASLGRFAEPILRRVLEVYDERNESPDFYQRNFITTAIDQATNGLADSSTAVH